MNLDALRQKLIFVDERFQGKYKELDRDRIKNILLSDMSLSKLLCKLENEEMCRKLDNNGIIGVDGSINIYGGIYPHYIAVVQAMAKSTEKEEEDIVVQDVYVPFFEEDEGQAEDESKRRARMSRLELEAASEACERFKSNLILMDGSLMHYMIDCPGEWESFKYKVLSSGKIIIGITEEVKTKDIINVIKDYVDIKDNFMYDREVLFGMLREGELLEFKHSMTKKAQSGIRSCYVRLSEDPQVAGFDFLEEQYSQGMKYCDLIYTLTPKKGRGIPLWLDIVDKEVKVTDEMVKVLVESSISKEIREMLLNPKRSKRG